MVLAVVALHWPAATIRVAQPRMRLDDVMPVMALGDSTRRGMGRYWRLIVPGSGLLRREWLDGIRRRAESAG